MLTSLEEVKAMPGLACEANTPAAWLSTLVQAADRAVKEYLKRDIELTTYTDYYDGSNTTDIVARQFPVRSAQTTVSALSSGVALPTATIHVASTAGFHPGDEGDPLGEQDDPCVTVQSGANSYSVVYYTGVTATSFTGCYGGTGTLATSYKVATPVVNFDPNGYYGQGPDAFPDGTLLTKGTTWVVVADADRGRKSHRGLIRRIGGGGVWSGFYSQMLWGTGKLAAQRLPFWPYGQGNIKIRYVAGYDADEIPQDIRQATTMLAAYFVRNAPSGAALSSETGAGFSYAVFKQDNEVPEIGAIARILARHRETSW